MGDFPGGLVVKTSPPKARSAGSVPAQGAKIPGALWQKKDQNVKTEGIL